VCVKRFANSEKKNSIMKIATVVPRTNFDKDSELINYENFAGYLEEASDRGADLVVFPESYPDNWKPPAHLNLLDKFEILAKKYKLHIIASNRLNGLVSY
jgi:predicted amidohydrolase